MNIEDMRGQLATCLDLQCANLAPQQKAGFQDGFQFAVDKGSIEIMQISVGLLTDFLDVLEGPDRDYRVGKLLGFLFFYQSIIALGVTLYGEAQEATKH